MAVWSEDCHGHHASPARKLQEDVSWLTLPMLHGLYVDSAKNKLMMIFMSDQCALTMGQSTDIFCDWTFNTCPDSFVQEFFIMGQMGPAKMVMPCIFCTAPRERSSDLYEAVNDHQIPDDIPRGHQILIKGFSLHWGMCFLSSVQAWNTRWRIEKKTEQGLSTFRLVCAIQRRRRKSEDRKYSTNRKNGIKMRLGKGQKIKIRLVPNFQKLWENHEAFHAKRLRAN